MYGVYTKETADAIYQWYKSQVRNVGDNPSKANWVDTWYFVKLVEDLDIATDPETGYTQALANVIKYTNTDDSLDRSELTTEELQITVTNRSTSFSGTEGDYLWVVKPHDLAEFIPLVPSGGGGGGCDACCTSVPTGNMLHPDLASGFNETTRDWIAQSACGGAIDSVTIPNASGSLRLVWSGGTPTLTYEDTDDTYVYEITDECTILEPDGKIGRAHV